MIDQFLPNNEQESKEYQPRYRLFYSAIAAVFAIFALRLWQLQIIDGVEYRAFSERNSIKETKIGAPRGVFYDRNGKILVENLPGFELLLSPQFVESLEETAVALEEVLKIPASQIISLVQRSRKTNGPFRPVRIKSNLSREEMHRVELLKLDFTGIEIKETVLRSYPLKEDGAQLFGYVGEISKKELPLLNKRLAGVAQFQQGDIIGTSGLEKVYDLEIRGKDGIAVSQVDAHGRENAGDPLGLLGGVAGITTAVPGNNLVLTIDEDIQAAAWKAFRDGDRIGAAVAMKSNGEILAWVSSPSFDPNQFSIGYAPTMWRDLINDPDRPLRNKVIQDHNSPGSTFKPFIALAALSEKVITPQTVVSCPGVFQFGGRPYHDTLKQGHGNLIVTQAIERSANVFFYKMGISLGIDRMYKHCGALGIGRRTGIELPGERAGLMPSSDWKQETYGQPWQAGENLSVAIGQGFVLTTPLQMAVAYNAIGTGGKIVKPFVVKRVVAPDQTVIKEFSPTVVRDLSDPNGPYHISPEVFETVQEGLRLVVNGDRGTARGQKILGTEIAGKTGTSQVRSFSADQIYIKCESQPKHQRHHGWFIGYAPAKNPEIAFGILSEHSCHGSSGAAPVARAMVEAYIAKYMPDRLAKPAAPSAPAPVPAVHRKTASEDVEGE